jgi:hypothetical protein
MAEHPALVAAVSFGIPGVERVVEIPREVASDILGVAHVDRLAGFLGRALCAGLVRADEETAHHIEDMWHKQLAASVAAEALALRVAVVLDTAAVAWRLTKGPALAHLDYGDPSLRTFGDVDVVVALRDWTRALAALGRAGITRRHPELRRGFDIRYGKGATLQDRNGLEVDAHLRFAIGRYGLTSCMDDVFERADQLAVGGSLLPVLAADHRLVHACFHAVLGGRRHLRALRDVAQLLLVTGVDTSSVLALARRWRAEAVVAAAVDECWSVFGLADHHHEVHAWATDYPVDQREQHLLDVFRHERSFRAQALTGLGVLPWLRRPHYLWSLAGPTFDLLGRRRRLGARLRAAVRRR